MANVMPSAPAMPAGSVNRKRKSLTKPDPTATRLVNHACPVRPPPFVVKRSTSPATAASPSRLSPVAGEKSGYARQPSDGAPRSSFVTVHSFLPPGPNDPAPPAEQSPENDTA